MKYPLKYIIRFSILFIFWSDLINLSKMDQNRSNLIKTDQTWSNLISDEIIIEIYHQIYNFIHFLIKLDFWWNNHWNISSDFQFYLFWSDWIRSVQNGSKWIKMDQIGSLMEQSLNIRFSTLFIFSSRPSESS